MIRSLAHRGPDGQGMEIFRAEDWGVGLGHTRLAILDLTSRGRQPMADEKGLCWVAYNGEVYNFTQIRDELRSLGYSFRSRSDTEVILAAYRAWGIDCLKRFRGMFAFGLWDSTKKQLFLARDPFGIKPLYYYKTESCFLFASEVKALVSSSLIPKRLSPEGVLSYLRYGSVEGPRAILKEVHSLPAGHYLAVNLQEDTLFFEEVPFFRLASFEQTTLSNRTEAVDRIRNVLEDSARAHLISEVPVGIFLSGGIDSSAIVALISRAGLPKPKTFTVVFKERAFSEARHARLIAQRFGTEHAEILLEEADLLPLLPEALAAMDQPSFDGINVYVISKSVKRAGITVALSGLGGDELFGGYPSFARFRQLDPLRGRPLWFRKILASTLNPFLAGHPRLKANDLLSGDLTPSQVYANSRTLFLPQEIAALVPDAASPQQSAPVLSAWCSTENRDSFQTLSLCEMSHYMANALLRDTDSMSMAHALEVRVPFVDREVVQTVLSVPTQWQIDRSRPKPLLLDALGGLLPPEIWRRPKMGFVLPFESWMRSALLNKLEKCLGGERAPLARIGFSSEGVRAVWETFKKNPRKMSWSRPWALYVLSEWCERNHVEQ